MKHARIVWLALAGLLVAVPGTGNMAEADSKKRILKADLTGYEEPPSVSSTGSGEFRAQISRDGTQFEYALRFEDLEGDVTQAHIHVGQRGVNGGISVWLCTTPAIATAPPGTPSCGGPRAGSVTRAVSAADVVGPAGQGIAAGEFEEFLAAVREGVAYANVHSTRNPGGEIRGQIRDWGH